MKRFCIAAITCLALVVGVSPATAGSGLGGVVQTVTGTSQENTNAASDASAWNANHTGQSNEQGQAGYGGDASTGDATTGGAGCCGSSGDATSGDAYGGDVPQSQEATNSNSTSQTATAESKAVQVAPVNVAAPICFALHCESGAVEQSNSNSSGDASAGNVNRTDQSNEQWQAGVGGDATTGDATSGGSGDATTGDAAGGDVTQSQQASNSNTTSQDATAVSEAKQIAPVNVYAPVCIAKHCRTGDVEQSNSNSSGDASAWNANRTGQSNEQWQKGVGGDATTGDATASDCCKPSPKPGCKPDRGWHNKGYGGKGKPRCDKGEPKHQPHGADARSGDATGGDVDQRQQAQNDNRTSQTAYAASTATQEKALNLILVPWKPAPHGCRPC
jgi:hypothetical protein